MRNGHVQKGQKSSEAAQLPPPDATELLETNGHALPQSDESDVGLHGLLSALQAMREIGRAHV